MVVILSAASFAQAPGVENVFLSSSPSGSFMTADDLTCNYGLAGPATTSATAWYRNGAPYSVLHMPFEGGPAAALLDYSGNGFAATANGSPVWNPTGGHDGNGAFEFDGTDDYLVIPDDPALDVDYITLAAWIYIDSLVADPRIISKESGTTSPFTIYSMRIAVAVQRLELYISTEDSPHPHSTLSDAVIPTKQWVHVVATYDGSESILYINGLPDFSSRPSGVLRKNDEPVYIGASQFYDRKFDGIIDDARIYDFPMTADEVAALYNGSGDVVSADATTGGEQWFASVTPFSSSAAGTAVSSDTVTIDGVVVPDPPVITSTPVTTATELVPYSYDVDASGSPAPTYSLDTAPASMTINSTTGVINWTPAAAGVDTVAVVATNIHGTDTQGFNIVVSAATPDPPVITSAPVTTGTATLLYTYDVDASGSPAPDYSLDTAPAGMTINSTTGVINWTPAAPGVDTVAVVATNIHGSDTQGFNIVVADVPVGGGSVDNVALSSPSGNFESSDDLTCTYGLVAPATTASTAWFRDGAPYAALQMPFEGGPAAALLDYSGNGFAATANGSPVWNPTGGHDGNGAFDFDGTDDYLVIPDDPALDADYITLAAWIYIDSLVADPRIISKESGTTSPFTIYSMRIAVAVQRLELYIATEGSAFAHSTLSDAVIPTKQWVHVVATYDGSESILYIDGLPDFSSRPSGVLRKNDEPVYIGASQFYDRYFDGVIDDARIYDFPMTADEVADLYNGGGDVVSADATTSGEQWSATVTPFSSTAMGTSASSDTVTIDGGPPVGAGDGVPSQTALMQNHPNPFNPTTTIEYSLDAGGSVSLRVYDVSGRLVRTLVEGEKGPGAHAEVWNGRNDRGEAVSTGVYFYRLRAGEKVLTRKAVLLK
jgi:hypothetical protein